MKRIAALMISLSFFLFASCSASDITDKLSGSVDNVEQFLEYVDQNDVADAKNVYRDKIKGDKEKESDVTAELISRLDKAISDYNSGAMTDNKAVEVFDTITALNVMQNEELSTRRDQLDSLISSKAAYDSAEAFSKSGDHYNAYKQYVLVAEDDTNYSSAVKKAAAAADEYLRITIETVNSSKNAHDYVQALSTINGALQFMPQNQQLISAKTIAEAEYLQYALGEADRIHRNGNDYEGAIRIIQDAMKDINDPSLTDALNYYRTFTPVDLFGMEMYAGNLGYLDAISPSDSDRYGNKYTCGIERRNLKPYHVYLHDDPYEAYYQVNGGYNRLTGVIVPGDECENLVDSKVRSQIFNTIKIYADDKLIYDKTVYFDSEPIKVDLDISNVKMIHVQFYANNQTKEYDTHDIDIMYADFYVQKTIK